nr:slit homolog 3 protein-like [Parasteatoda tepidariorum]
MRCPFLSIDDNAFAQAHLLFKLHLSHTKFHEIPSAICNTKTLKSLEIEDGKLTEITTELQSMSELNIDLSFNALSTIPEDLFNNLENLMVINLEGNFIRSIGNCFAQSHRLEYINLRNNWACDCRLLWIKEWSEHATFKNLNNEFNCSSPLSFKSKLLNQLTKQDLSWPKEDCPTGCQCSCAPYQEDGYANVDCSSKRLSRIPSRFPEFTIELNLRENLLSNPIELNLPPMSKLLTLNLERNFISRLDFSLPNNIETLRLAENNITRFFNNPPSNIKTFTLSHNPWQCDCDTLPFRKWIMVESSKILDVNDTRCSFEEDRENMRGRVIITLSEIELCPKLIRNYILMGVGGAVILMMTVASILLYFRYRYHLKVWLYSRGWRCFKKRDKRDDGKLFDAYISFTDEDADSVRKHFLPDNYIE